MSISDINRPWLRRTVLVVVAVPVLIIAALLGAVIGASQIALDIKDVW